MYKKKMNGQAICECRFSGIILWNVRVCLQQQFEIFFLYIVSEKLKTGTCENKVDVEIRPYWCLV